MFVKNETHRQGEIDGVRKEMEPIAFSEAVVLIGQMEKKEIEGRRQSKVPSIPGVESQSCPQIIDTHPAEHIGDIANSG